MPNGNPHDDLERLKRKFEEAADFYFARAEPSKPAEVVAALRASLGSFTKAAKGSLRPAVLEQNRGCPIGWKPCPDGSCVPEEDPCPPPQPS